MTPFNFVPIPQAAPLYRYPNSNALPAHNKIEPGLLSGVIQMTLTADTPVFVGGKQQSADFYHTIGGQPALPSSTVRGMLRENMKVLGLGQVRLGDDIEAVGGQPLGKLLPENQSKKNKPGAVDYPQAILGFIDTLGEHSYRSRVSVSDFETAQDVKPLPAVGLRSYRPDPSDANIYMVGGIPAGQEGAKIRGSKCCWLKNPGSVQVNAPNVIFRPLPRGTRFYGEVQFHNLTKDELGLLLWAARLQPGCWQSIGRAKAEGYGRMGVTIDHLRLFRPEALYQGLAFTPGEEAPDAVQQYIDAYDAYAAAQVSRQENTPLKSLTELSEIADFLFMHSTILTPEVLDSLSQLLTVQPGSPLPDVKTIRTRPAPAPEPEEPDDPEALAASLLALQARYSKRFDKRKKG